MKRRFTKYPSNYVRATKFVAEYYTKDASGIGTIASTKVEIDADNIDIATDIAQRRSEARQYDNLIVSEYTSDREQMYMLVVGMQYCPERDPGGGPGGFMPRPDGEYISIKAKTEQQARQYYNQHLKGQYCNRHCKLSDDGYWKFGRLIESYPIGRGTGDYDATVGA